MQKISFEFFPPKDNVGRDILEKNSKKLVGCDPEFFSVTYGAGGSTKQGTLETVKMLKEKTSVMSLPHLSCTNATEREIDTLLDEYSSLGINRIVALRGDKQLDTTTFGCFHYASDLIKFIRQKMSSNFHITVAAYPEVHPESKNAVQGLLHFKEKIDAGADSAITQFFYNPDAYFNFLDQCAAQHINVPILPGIMPIYNLEKLMRFSKFCGADIPRWIIQQLSSYDANSDSFKKVSLEIVYKLCEKLLKQGVPGLHFYTLNQATTCLHLCELLGFISDSKNSPQPAQYSECRSNE